jgi:phenol 2-monooxygenase (NADPH)
LVTGGARGCGLAFAQSCAEAGADVVIFDVIGPDDTFQALNEKYGVRTAYYESVLCTLGLWFLLLTVYRVDVSSEQSLQNGFDRFKFDFSNALDICIPCAGINRHLSFLEFSYEDHHDLLSVNVLGSYFTAQLAARQMIANGTRHGSIILVASIAGQRAIRSQLCSAYCGSKGAVKAMCPAIAQELAPHVSFNLLLYCITTDEQGIRVDSISPGYVRTEMTTGVSTFMIQRTTLTAIPVPSIA